MVLDDDIVAFVDVYVEQKQVREAVAVHEVGNVRSSKVQASSRFWLTDGHDVH